jgi:triacylglycerol esterase/lipase EstA (alpha/beta hydrolase family)
MGKAINKSGKKKNNNLGLVEIINRKRKEKGHVSDITEASSIFSFFLFLLQVK